MVDTLHPANAVAGAPSYNGRMLRQMRAVAMAGATPTRPLGTRSGVRPGTPATTVTATSTTWTCQPFAGEADVMTAAEASGYAFAFDAVATGAMTAAHATLPRKDILYVSVADPAESIGAAPAVTRKYLAGVANASPTAPAVPGAERGFVVAEINVPVSGGGAPSVTWVAPYAVAAGGVLPVRNQAELDAYTPGDGAFAYRADQDLVWVRRGGTWFVAPGQVLGYMTSSSGTGVAGTIIGTVASTPTLPLGQALKVRTRPGGAATTSPSHIIYMLRIRNHASDVTDTTFDKAVASRTSQGGGGLVASLVPVETRFVTTVAAKVSAAMFLGGGLGTMFAADGQELWIESA